MTQGQNWSLRTEKPQRRTNIGSGTQVLEARYHSHFPMVKGKLKQDCCNASEPAPLSCCSCPRGVEEGGPTSWNCGLGPSGLAFYLPGWLVVLPACCYPLNKESAHAGASSRAMLSGQGLFRLAGYDALKDKGHMCSWTTVWLREEASQVRNSPLEAETIAALEKLEILWEDSKGTRSWRKVIIAVLQIISLDQNRTIKMTRDKKKLWSPAHYLRWTVCDYFSLYHLLLG